MPSRRVAEAECRRLNRARMIRQFGSYSLQRFWRDAYGSYLIAGGTQIEREEILLGRLRSLVARDDLPIVFLTTDQGMVGLLNRWAMGLGLPIIVTSPQNRNYHFFYGMDDNSIVACFLRLAQSQGYHDTAEMESYIRAFLSVIHSFYLPSLPAMIQLAQRSTDRVADVAMQRGLSQSILNILHRNTTAGTSFHNLLLHFSGKLMQLGGMDLDTRTNITTTALHANTKNVKSMIHLVEVSTVDPIVVGQYFGSEIYNMLTHSMPFHLVLDDIRVLESDMLGKAIDLARNSNMCDLGVCVGNPWLAFNEERYVNGYQSMLLLTRGGELDNQGIDKLLEKFGKYTHWEPVMVGPGHFFEIIHRDYSIQSMERNRVRLEDVRNARAVLYGPWNHEVAIARTLTT